MKNPYKLLLLDVDGTVVASNGEALPSERVREAVRLAQNRVHIALATGRPLGLAQHVIDALELRGPSVLNGGAEIIDVTTKQVLRHQLMSIAALRELVKLALPFGYNIYTDEEQYGTPITDPAQVTQEAAKLLIEAVPAKDIVALLEELTAVKGTAAHPTSSWNSGDVVDIHVTHEHATKRYGVEKLIKMLGLSKGEVIAIGDSHNDLPLLDAAGFKVVMGNGPAEVKAVADYIAPSLAEDGVAEAIERFILN